jgi:hypothetical protein
MLKKAKSDSSRNQRQRLLEHFKAKPQITVAQAREWLGIMSPPARIIELRRQGYRIDTLFQTEFDSLGYRHRNGIYVYKGGKKL